MKTFQLQIAQSESPTPPDLMVDSPSADIRNYSHLPRAMLDLAAEIDRAISGGWAPTYLPKSN
jgi:hypothetical protein